jgi:hypothetical protein
MWDGPCGSRFKIRRLFVAVCDDVDVDSCYRLLANEHANVDAVADVQTEWKWK